MAKVPSPPPRPLALQLSANEESDENLASVAPHRHEAGLRTEARPRLRAAPICVRVCTGRARSKARAGTDPNPVRRCGRERPANGRWPAGPEPGPPKVLGLGVGGFALDGALGQDAPQPGPWRRLFDPHQRHGLSERDAPELRDGEGRPTGQAHRLLRSLQHRPGSGRDARLRPGRGGGRGPSRLSTAAPTPAR